jgi:hypothetical protein
VTSADVWAFITAQRTGSTGRRLRVVSDEKGLSGRSTDPDSSAYITSPSFTFRTHGEPHGAPEAEKEGEADDDAHDHGDRLNDSDPTRT